MKRLLAAILFLVAACGGGGEPYDRRGCYPGETEIGVVRVEAVTRYRGISEWNEYSVCA